MTKARSFIEVVARELAKLDGKDPDFKQWLPNGTEHPAWMGYLTKAKKIKTALAKNRRRMGLAIDNKRTSI